MSVHGPAASFQAERFTHHIPLDPHAHPEQARSSKLGCARMCLAGTDDDSTNTGDYQEQAEAPDHWSRTTQHDVRIYENLPDPTSNETNQQPKREPQQWITERLQHKSAGHAAQNKTAKEMPDQEASSAVGTGWTQAARHQTLCSWPSDQCDREQSGKPNANDEQTMNWRMGQIPANRIGIVNDQA